MRFFTFALLSAWLLTACSKKEADPVPADPSTELRMTRTMTYPTATSRNTGLTYSQQSLTGTGSLDAKQLQLAFDVPEGSDYLSFTVPQSALPVNLLGTYQLQDSQHLASTPVQATYIYTKLNVPGASSSVIILGVSHSTQGQLLITAYDPTRQLLSGSFAMSIEGLADPTDSRAAPNVPPLCNLEVTGTFTNLKLK